MNYVIYERGYKATYNENNQRIFTIDEIVEAEFVFVPFPTFIHDYSDPYKPIMKSYVKGFNGTDTVTFPLSDVNYKPLVIRSSMFGPYYIRNCGYDAGTRRGIHSIRDYHYKKDIFKPMIIKHMKDLNLHYIYEVILGDSPCIWEDDLPSIAGKHYNYMFPVFIRGARIPPKI